MPDAAASRGVLRVALDTAVGEVHAKDGFVTAHGSPGVFGAAPVLRVDQAFAGQRVAVAEIEVGRVDIGSEVVRAHGAREIDQRVEFLDVGQAPVGMPAKRDKAGTCFGLMPRCFGSRRFLPHEAGVQVADRAVAVVAVKQSGAGVSGVLAGKRCAPRRAGDFSTRDAVTAILAGRWRGKLVVFGVACDAGRQRGEGECNHLDGGAHGAFLLRGQMPSLGRKMGEK